MYKNFDNAAKPVCRFIQAGFVSKPVYVR